MTSDEIRSVLLLDDKYEWLRTLGLRYQQGGAVHMSSPIARLILTLETGSVLGGSIAEHRNRNVFDNRLANLRIATQQQNCVNRVHPKLRTDSRYGSRFRGVRKGRNKWQAGLKYYGKYIHLGSFASEEAAARAYDLKAVELHGSFAVCNFDRWEE